MALHFKYFLKQISHYWPRIHIRYLHDGKCLLHSRNSYFSGMSQDPLLDYTLGECLDRTASKYGDKEAIVVPYQNIRKTYSSFKAEVDRVACGLLSLHLNRGDRIGIWSPNNYEWVVMQFASAKIGLVLVSINPAYTANELEYCIKKVGMSAIVSADVFKNRNFYALLKSLLPSLPESREGIIMEEKFPKLRHVIMCSDNHLSGTFKFADFLTAGNQKQLNYLEKLQKEIQFDEPVNIQFTSGTTGKPKGTILSHHNMVNNAYFFGKRIGLENQRACIPAPLYHCIGNVLGTLASVIFGSCSIIASPIFNARSAAEAVHKEKATVIYGTPTMFIDILNLPEFKQYDFTSLQKGIMAGAPCPEEILKEVMEKMNIKQLTPCYGCTETSPVILQTLPEDSVEIRTQTVGRVLEHVEVKIVNPDNEIVPCGIQGELLTRGYLVMHGYWNDEEKTKECITNSRWYKTGDIAIMDENGYGRIVGRIKDMVIRGGENLFPREIEEILHTNPKISEAQVVGVPDKRLGEELCAWIKCKENQVLSEDDVKSFCTDKLAHFKVPRYVIFTEEFPKTPSGKIQKFILRENSIKKLDLQS